VTEQSEVVGDRHEGECETQPKQAPVENGENWKTRMWANAQPDGRPAEHRWRPLFNAAKFS